MTMQIALFEIWKTFCENSALAQWDSLNNPGFVGWIALAAIVSSFLANIGLVADRQFKLKPELAKMREETEKYRQETEKLRQETIKLQTESVAKTAEMLEKLQGKKIDYDKIVDQFTASVSKLVRQIESGIKPSELDKSREECCQLLADSVSSHIRWVEFAQLYHAHSPHELVEFVRDDLASDIKAFAERLRVLNLPILFEKIGKPRSPFQISRQSIKPWQRIINDVPLNFRDEVREAVSHQIFALFDAGEDKF